MTFKTSSFFITAGQSIALAFAFTSLATLAFSQATSSQPQEERFQRTFSVNQGATLSVDNFKGTIRVTGSDANQITVNVFRNFEGSDSDRRWWMAQTHVNFQSDPRHVHVEVEYPRNACWNSDCDDSHSDYTASVELTIQVPRKINVELSGHKPVMNISAVQGDIRIHSYKSPIEIDSTTGAIAIETYKESIHLKNVAIRGHLFLKDAKAETVIEANSLGDDVDLETGKGSIVLRVPQNTGMDVDYRGGRHSSFHTDFNLNVANSYPPESVRGKVNNGGTRVRARSDKGSISLEKLGL